jgi:hypothetical protein
MTFETVVMDESAYFKALADFLDAGRSQGFTSALNDLFDVCPLYERAMLFSAMQGIVLYNDSDLT